MVDREALQETGEGEVVIFPLHWPWCWRMHQQWGVTSGQEQGFRGPSRQTHHCTDHPTQPPPPFLPSPWPRWELANGSGLSVNIFFLYQRHIFQPLSKGGWLPWRGKGDKKRVREWGWNFPPSPSFLHSLSSALYIWHCLSPGLLVQTGKERLKEELSASQGRKILVIYYKLDQISVAMDIIPIDNILWELNHCGNVGKWQHCLIRKRRNWANTTESKLCCSWKKVWVLLVQLGVEKLPA